MGGARVGFCPANVSHDDVAQRALRRAARTWLAMLLTVWISALAAVDGPRLPE